jgi:hypothetical protein
MTLIKQSDLGVGTDWGFSLFFLGYGEDGKTPGERFNPVLELTHNHGTEKDAEFAYVAPAHPNANSVSTPCTPERAPRRTITVDATCSRLLRL